ncbi:MAG: TIGR02679 family protein [Myxococcales bacterium]|nr:TIGR02679 family protein [Myxococcales bacterium]
MSSQRDRLADALGGPALARLRERLRERIERGDSLASVLVLRSPHSEERRAVEGLLGRRPGRGESLSLRPLELERTLQDAGLADSLRDALARLDGPLLDRRQADAGRRRAWAAADVPVEALAATHPLALEVWRALRGEGQVRRAAGGDPEAARALSRGYAAGVVALDEAATTSGDVALSLAELATRITGDAHGLDPGRPLSALLLRYAMAARGVGDDAAARDPRALWRGVGVEVDPLSSHVLVLNLRLGGGGPVVEALRVYAEAGEPSRVTLRALQRHVQDVAAPRDVFVCENPMVVLAAARELGAHCRPLLCVEGQPSAAASALMGALRGAGARLWYHGDFDWPGIRIARGVVERHGAVPWRLSTADYTGAHGALPLTGARVEAPWDAALAAAMHARGIAVHEEAVVADLLVDLGNQRGAVSRRS